ncbi:hypothetical protein AVEN_173298-1, partial [Araneus ventricosus]
IALFLKTGLLGVPKLCLGTTGRATKKRGIWASRSCAWGQRDGLPKDGTFGRPEAVLGDNGTGYQQTGHLAVPKLCLGTKGRATKKRDIWASRSCAWGQRDVPPKKQDCPVRN